jgi:hypothetical protein
MGMRGLTPRALGNFATSVPASRTSSTAEKASSVLYNASHRSLNREQDALIPECRFRREAFDMGAPRDQWVINAGRPRLVGQ